MHSLTLSEEQYSLLYSLGEYQHNFLKINLLPLRLHVSDLKYKSNYFYKCKKSSVLIGVFKVYAYTEKKKP